MGTITRGKIVTGATSYSLLIQHEFATISNAVSRRKQIVEKLFKVSRIGLCYMLTVQFALACLSSEITYQHYAAPMLK